MKNIKTAVALFALLGLSVGAVALATHSWGGYHWARTANPFTLKLGDNLSTAWDPFLAAASSDWSVSTVLDTEVVPGSTTAKRCKPTAGRVEVCNSKYGRNGWLGIAGIYVNGAHITQGYVKMNDTYFSTAYYNTPEWKQLVLCQEIGHTFGLDHQDEDFGNTPLGTCMDYSSDPVPNQHPNEHDYDMLESIYAHLDGSTTLSATTISGNPSDIDTNDSSEWGRSIRTSKDGKASLYVREFAGGEKLFTFVFWAK
ncbi:hypothetical protein A2662_04265 [Candidatus Giovannonibacteria bacterium RIFCSPHIGHO2_01_FULL_45_33]|uniref:Peptidase M10 metallopeptidase domain-containing protein n=1 Tax=Candidatus Giovannonibacteria bacterium RIFCSPLOWO2_01_FULL_45_34 TaxID=1798351 RepID=A0A1F5WZ65_9BACT|nr:MAG: hypothetical protein A2662_04265 [Candidatus Giovannonibacteria bacterium RIFCSPHIGHO2_01_FULL_45_33]OGF69444.1 MAG: hypothetical protein A3C73_03880 [Candidatus Giovannonibacteria bacterium RIFCSPHIGHO2_02_FULL_44_11]OGF80944.1 MAG: hypothetical protein A2930_02570 [Candidatus Giovannonibacteria bacterium RIFCSPLOWO2_01_FULL_45_34]